MSRPTPPVYEVPKTRIGRLRERIIHAPQEVCIERARYLTEAMSRHWDRPPLTRMSLALEHILANISVVIRDDELIVGARTSKLKGAPLFPENKSRWIAGDLDNFDRRVLQRALITEAEKRELETAILPFWEGRTVEDLFEARLPDDIAADMDKYIFTMMLEITYGIGHFTMNHPRILREGLAGTIADARARCEALAPAERAGEKGLFYDAVIRSLRAAVAFANRYAALARALAVEAASPARRAELLDIADICERVPEHPARTFAEAVQCVYFIHLISQIESGGNSISLGRIDQILYPYYAADLADGRVTPEAARERLAFLFIKTNEIWNVLEEAFIPGGEGTEGKTTQNVTVGGMDARGEDATNALSEIGLDAFADIRTVQPNFGVRLCSQTPLAFIQKAVGYAKDAVPLHLFNDEAIVPALVRAGHTLEDARDYGVVGCLEPNAQGKAFCSTFAVQFNGIKCLEFALTNGTDNIFGYASGIETGDPATFTTFDEVWRAYDRQMTHFIGQMTRGMAVLDEAIAERVPSPFASAMIDGPLDKGLDLTRGGAVYNATGVQLMGFANVADSLRALEKAVFTDRVCTLAELVGWLADDWMDAEDRRLYFLDKIPKYGNDDDDADAMAARVMSHFCQTVSARKNFRGGSFWPGIFSVGFHLAFGSFTGATPDGRSAGDILGNGVTPANGRALNGPTAVFNSVTKLPLAEATNGVNLNMRFSGKRLKPEILLALIQGYFRRGGMQVQFNMIDSDVLKDAQAHPDQYRDLVVRISGYSVTFVDLSDTAQDEIINRMAFAL
ncbi:MAG TPA: formate C-acetyltransferase/glycerol dehydratase family glycyl radical enzyme [Syntrophales bacterium]|nr:formate C-acetyltransferase/glycerol dehydratase family glycyl radical enzyme [Syntrophales bacterium]